MGSRQIVLVSTAGFSVLNTGIFWREAKTKRLFSQCKYSRGAIAKFTKIQGDIRNFVFIAGVNNTDNKLFTGVNDTAINFYWCRCYWR